MTQKGFLIIEIGTGKKFVSPHVHFVWGEFPGLAPVGKVGRGTLSLQPHGNSSGLEASHGLPSPPAPPPPHVPPPGDGGDGGDSGDDRPPADEPSSDDSEDEGDAEPTIGQRLNRANRGRRPDRSVPRFESDRNAQPMAPVQSNANESCAERRKLRVPDGVEFIIYLYGGETIGDRSVAHYLRKAGVHAVTVDVKLGGYAHDVRIVSVQRQLTELASRPQCVGVLSSVPCGSWSVLRYVPQANAP
eukprot:2995488-Prymnesium_polylepis.1